MTRGSQSFLDGGPLRAECQTTQQLWLSAGIDFACQEAEANWRYVADFVESRLPALSEQKEQQELVHELQEIAAGYACDFTCEQRKGSSDHFLRRTNNNERAAIKKARKQLSILLNALAVLPRIEEPSRYAESLCQPISEKLKQLEDICRGDWESGNKPAAYRPIAMSKYRLMLSLAAWWEFHTREKPVGPTWCDFAAIVATAAGYALDSASVLRLFRTALSKQDGLEYFDLSGRKRVVYVLGAHCKAGSSLVTPTKEVRFLPR